MHMNDSPFVESVFLCSMCRLMVLFLQSLQESRESWHGGLVYKNRLEIDWSDYLISQKGNRL